MLYFYRYIIELFGPGSGTDLIQRAAAEIIDIVGGSDGNKCRGPVMELWHSGCDTNEDHMRSVLHPAQHTHSYYMGYTNIIQQYLSVGGGEPEFLLCTRIQHEPSR